MTDFEAMWRDLAPVGRSRASGGYFRQPFTAAEREAHAWFLEQCRARDLDVETDTVGNTVAWWGGAPTADGPSAVLTGSHLDSVLDGGAFDGPLGVVSALAAVDVLRERGVRPARPLGIGAFVEEEGSRFGIACLGSRLATGATSWEQAAALTDRDGVRFEDALADAGYPGGAGSRQARPAEGSRQARPAEGSRQARPAEGSLRDRVGCFVELHVEQGRDLVDRGVPVGVARSIWPHGRYRFDFSGEANHAGTTRMEDRRDPMLSYAMTVLAANKQARLAGQRATFGRVEVQPNGTNAVPSAVTAWLDARAATSDELDTLLGDVERLAAERAGRDGTALQVTAESVSGEVRFDAALAARIAALGTAATGAGGEGAHAGWPVIPTMAGHDAGVLSAAGIPTAMLFVRNPTGVSHSPAEHAETADCMAGVDALADTLAMLLDDPGGERGDG